jgi:hypothetical protein
VQRVTSTFDQRSAAAALLRDRGVLRMSMRGRSMLPALSDRMVLQIGPATNVRIGDILVFAQGDVRVAHRVVGIERGGFRTAGDAQPEVVESVSRDDVLGRVVAIWSDASAAARRVDRTSHRLRGWYLARFHPVRRYGRRTGARIADLAARLQPRRRARTTLQLCEALAAAAASDAARLAASVTHELVGPGSSGERHRCVAVLGEAARRLGITQELPADVAAVIRQSCWKSVAATSRMDRALRAAIETLQEIGVPFALLKGAARVYAAAPEAAYHTSDDIDVLIAASDRDRVVTAMRRRGYTSTGDPAAAERRYRRHHHAVPLFPPDGAFPVELHDELAPPRTLSTGTHWTDLSHRLIPVTGPCGTLLRLDPVASALHLAIHAMGLRRLRDVVLLASALRSLDAADFEAFESIVRAERRDPVRLQASVALAARIAGIDWEAGRPVERYLRWALVREDLPAALRTRSDAVDNYFAFPHARWYACAGLIPWWSTGRDVAFAPLRSVGLCATNAAAIVYAALMPQGVPPRLGRGG